MFAGRGKRLTIFIGESDHYHHQPLYMALIERLRREGCGGATAVRGIAGFGGASRMIHTATILRLSMDMPIVITVVDRPERIDRIMPVVIDMAPHALITLEDVEVVHSGVPFREGLPDVPVAEIMRRQVVTVRPDSTIATLLELLLDKDFTALPVVDAEGRVVGMVSDDDLLTRAAVNVPLEAQRAAEPAFVDALHEEVKHPQRQVSEIMTRKVRTISPGTSLGAAARLMTDHDLKRLPVVDERQHLVGIVGRLDVLNTIAAVHLPEWHAGAHTIDAQAVVGDVMDRDVPAVTASAGLEDVFARLVASIHKRVVVVDEQQHVVGIIGDRDLLSRVERSGGLLEALTAKVPIDRISSAAKQQLRRMHGQTAGELASTDVATLRQEMPVASALALSAEKHIKQFPVIDAEERLVGIVGRTEMLRALMRRR
jgi:CBS-domain-containing membrane protein/PII-like signaling protein